MKAWVQICKVFPFFQVNEHESVSQAIMFFSVFLSPEALCPQAFDMFFSRCFFGTSGRLFQDSLLGSISDLTNIFCCMWPRMTLRRCIPASMRCLQASMDLPKTSKQLALYHLLIHKDLARGVFLTKDRNSFKGPVPSSYKSLTKLVDFTLHRKLGPHFRLLR